MGRFKETRTYFWSNKFVDPKRKFKFTVEFGGEFDRLSLGKYPWMVKSVSRPKLTADYDTKDFVNQFTNQIGAVFPAEWSWKEITIKFVNPYSFTFAAQVKQDLDEILNTYTSAKGKASTYRASRGEPGAQSKSNPDDFNDPLSERLLGRQVKIYDLSMAYEPQEAIDKLYAGLDQNAIPNNSWYNLTPQEVQMGEMYPNGCWTLNGPFITAIDFGDFDYSSDDLLEISMTFKFKTAEYQSFFHDKLVSRDPDKAAIIAEEASKVARAINDSKLSREEKSQSLEILNNNIDEQLLKRFEPTSFADQGLKAKRLAEIQKAKDYIGASLDVNQALKELGQAVREPESAFNGRYADALTGLSNASDTKLQAYENLTFGQDAVNYTSGVDTYEPPPVERKRNSTPKSTTPSTSNDTSATLPATTTPTPEPAKTPSTTPKPTNCRDISDAMAALNSGVDVSAIERTYNCKF